MSKKQSIKEMFHEKVNPHSIYNEVVLKEENKKRYSVRKFAFAAACLLVLTGIGIWTQRNPQLGGQNDVIEKGNDRVIEVNQNGEMYMADIDIQFKNIDDLNNPIFDFLKKLTMPSDFNQSAKSAQELYTRGTDGEYMLHSYSFIFSGSTENRMVQLTFSKIDMPPRCALLIGGEKKSYIGDTEIEIQQCQDSYYIYFEYKDMYFDITVQGMNLEELVDFLASIVEA